MTDITRCDDKAEWDELVKAAHGHPLQLWGWGDVKASHGWRVERVKVGKGGAQLLIKPLPGPFGPMVYVPRGPFGAALEDERLRNDLVDYVKTTYRPTVMTVEPDTTTPIKWNGWRRSPSRILLARTGVMDLTKSDDELMGVMSKKTRQYIRKSAGEAIEVIRAASLGDVDECLKIYRQTAMRAGFALHDDSYYHDIFTNLGDASPIYMARHNGATVAFLWPIFTPEVAFELYGGMNEQGQALRANYHLKWSVIQTMKGQGIHRYDVNGLLNDGVSAFKQGFIPEETQMSGTFDRPLSPLYPIWTTLLPAAKKIAQKLR
jgi:peptidoglycan pentaglycine glycine transferase (the first glycine)